jgi:hypothetical protein
MIKPGTQFLQAKILSVQAAARRKSQPNFAFFRYFLPVFSYLSC